MAAATVAVEQAGQVRTLHATRHQCGPAPDDHVPDDHVPDDLVRDDHVPDDLVRDGPDAGHRRLFCRQPSQKGYGHD